jgi:biopolymer transport protein ExbB
MRENNSKFLKAGIVSFYLIVMNITCFADSAGKELEQKSSETMLSLLIQGGPVMIPLLICSIVVLTIIIERFISLRKIKILPVGFSLRMKENMGKCTVNDLNKTIEFCKATPSPMSNIIKSGIGRCKAKRKMAEVEEAMEDIASREVRSLKGSLQGLKIIAAISPLLGLLGTVYGMITAFQSVANATVGVAKAERLAEGIYEAMVTTATGLTIAIPVLLIYYFLIYRIDKCMIEMEEICDDFIDVLIESNIEKNEDKV